MTLGLEVLAAAQHIYGKLAADSALTAVVSTRIYHQEAPQGVSYPFVVFSFLSGIDYPVAGGGRLWTNQLWLIEAVDKASSFGGNLRTAATRLDAALQATDSTVTDGVISACVREEAFSLAEVGPGGEQYRRMGGRYRIYAR